MLTLVIKDEFEEKENVTDERMDMGNNNASQIGATHGQIQKFRQKNILLQNIKQLGF